MTRFLVVPQWQGSPSARAMLLVDGAEAIAGDLPRSSCSRIEVPLEAGESLGTSVQRLSALDRVSGLLATELTGHTEPVLVVGGDCGVAVPAIAHAAERHGDIAVVWCDAHGDLHDPSSSPSGAFAGMALRAAMGDGEAVLARHAVTADRVVLVGARDLDVAESAFADAVDLPRLPISALSDPESLADAVAATGATAVYIHVDLDVLDPAVVTGVSVPVPFGADVAELVAAIGRLRARIPLVGSSIAGFAPATPAAAVEDLGAILRIVGALA